MEKRFEGKVAFITGAARGQGRSHALNFAREGAAVAVSDICADVASVPYGLSKDGDLEETVRLCEAEGVRAISARVDVRDYEQVAAFAARTRDELGEIDVLVANAGIFTFGTLTEMSSEQFDDMIDTNLKGTWHTVKAVVPGMAERKYGRVVIIGSSASLIGYPNVGHYVASKHAVWGLTKSLALEQAPNKVTVNCVCPTGVHTTMLENEAAYALMNPENPTLEGALPALASLNPLGDPWLEPEDVSRMVLFLASDEAHYITGAEFKVDMGLTAP
jgi:SDR family mycofactocin-dependent oxidoreductase